MLVGLLITPFGVTFMVDGTSKPPSKPTIARETRREALNLGPFYSANPRQTFNEVDSMASGQEENTQPKIYINAQRGALDIRLGVLT